MTKQEILDRFSDIDFVYNDSSKRETLSRMLDELLKEQEEEIESLRQTCQSMMEGIVVTASNKKKLPYLPGSNVQWT